MAITTEIDPENNLIIQKIMGRISIDEIIGANNDALKFLGFHPGMHAIWDLRKADIGHFSTNDLTVLSKFLFRQSSWRGTHYKLAVVATKEINFIVSPDF